MNSFTASQELSSITPPWSEGPVYIICASVGQSSLTLCNPMDCNTPGFPVLHYLPEFAQTHVHWVSDNNDNPTISSSVPPLLLLPSIFPSIRGFSNETALSIRWPKYWNFRFSISPNEYSGLISFRIDRFDLLAVQGTLKSLLQHHSWKPSILQHSALKGRVSTWRVRGGVHTRPWAQVWLTACGSHEDCVQGSHGFFTCLGFRSIWTV